MCLDNRPELRDLGFCGIYLSKSNPVGIIIDAFQNCTVSDAEILQMLMNSKILETVNGMNESSLIVESRSLTLLLSRVSSPACVKVAKKDAGTATLVSCRGVNIALTCSHVIGKGVYGAVVFFCGKDGDTNKFKLESDSVTVSATQTLREFFPCRIIRSWSICLRRLKPL